MNKFSQVNNPLTIIAIFAGLVEVAGTAVLSSLTPELQSIFIWYLMGFPIALVLLFFITLNFNSKVLYSPSDFRDEKNYITALLGSKAIESELREVDSMVEEIKGQLAEQVSEGHADSENQASKILLDSLESKFVALEKSIDALKDTAERVSASVPDIHLTELEERILSYLEEKQPATGQGLISVSQIADALNVDWRIVQKSLFKLIKQDILTGGLAAEELHVRKKATYSRNAASVGT